MSDSVQPHRRQPTRLPRLWDSPGKNTGVGCHFLLQCMKVKSKSEVAQSCPTPSDPMDCSLPGSFIHWIFQARALEWGAIAFSADVHLNCAQFEKVLYFLGAVSSAINQANDTAHRADGRDNDIMDKLEHSKHLNVRRHRSHHCPW